MSGRWTRPLTCCALALFAIIAAGSATAVSAQVVQGVVLTADSGEPVSGARLLLRDPDGVIRAGMISSDRGRFELRADLAGMLRLEVSHIGYADWRTAAFALGTGQTLDVEVKLGIEAIPLEPIVVVARRSTGVSRTAQFLQRMNDPARVGGYFIPEEDIESRPASLASTLVVGTPGMSVRLASSAAGLERNVIMAGECQAQAFVDGIRVQQGGGASVDDVVTVDRLAGVEMYPRALGAPSQYVDTHNPRCGVVLYWTREAESSEATSWGRGRIAVGIGIVAGLITWGMVG